MSKKSKKRSNNKLNADTLVNVVEVNVQLDRGLEAAVGLWHIHMHEQAMAIDSGDEGEIADTRYEVAISRYIMLDFMRTKAEYNLKAVVDGMKEVSATSGDKATIERRDLALSAGRGLAGILSQELEAINEEIKKNEVEIEEAEKEAETKGIRFKK